MTVLRWGLKRSLRAYTLAMSDGSITTSAGAKAEGEVFLFPGTGLTFAGAVRFRGHGGLMDVKLADPSLVETPSGWAVDIADPDDAGARLRFARVASFDGTAGRGVTLAQDGADLFFGPYEDGTPLDDLVVDA